RETGRIRVLHVGVAQDCGFMINPDGVLNQVQGNVVHGISRAIKEELRYDRGRVTSLDWDQYQTLRFSEVPQVTVELIQRRDLAPSVVGELASVPTVAAVGNAIYDATGVRMREAPFSAERVRMALGSAARRSPSRGCLAES